MCDYREVMCFRFGHGDRVSGGRGFEEKEVALGTERVWRY